MSEEKALELGFKPKAYLREWTFSASDPFDEMLLGPAYATAKVLNMAGMKLSDFGVIEFHEAFAGQVLSNVVALNSQKFFDESLGGVAKVGEIPMEKFNTLGGSLSIGHPFGATGGRLVRRSTPSQPQIPALPVSLTDFGAGAFRPFRPRSLRSPTV